MTSSIWLGLFAMLMIHVGPLYSALQMAQAQPHAEHHQHAHHSTPVSAHAHHGKPSAGEPEWLAALEMCGYCELLTLSPALILALLILSLQLVLPRHQPQQAQPLPETPRRPTLRHGDSQPRAPPVHIHS